MTHDYCAEDIHVRDTTTGACLECGEEPKDWVDELTRLVAHEPPTSSIVITEGATGTAWQRFNSDGRWHSTTGKTTSWERLCRNFRASAPVRIVYLPPRS